ncbi:GNAT family N-acetyltransferase [Nocardioides sp.]|uniref:GNAT family N-acetyltransferase n=1 Tax=Nocardioides sp. TaxID=35761 RepID=UPI002D7F91F6|nr:GNAT family N-acetyltransferase [Nocardioides sp.]HET8960930.1 GNAT family N-acetyltransferase [Nocardioides sp.]
MKIRAAGEADLTGIAAIYGHEARTGFATFDTEPRPINQWREHLDSTENGDHLLVATDDETILGYAHSSAYRPKPCYAATRETSIYLTAQAQGQGLGRRMYDDLLGWLVADGIRTVVAAVALPNPASLALHRACGFEEVGAMREVGRKFDRWIDVLWLQCGLSRRHERASGDDVSGAVSTR